jgi:hypothetical protein
MARLFRGLLAVWKDYNGMRDVAQLSIRRTAVFVQQYQQKRQELLALLGRTDAIKAQVVENGVKQLNLGSMQSEHEARHTSNCDRRTFDIRFRPIVVVWFAGRCNPAEVRGAHARREGRATQGRVNQAHESRTPSAQAS